MVCAVLKKCVSRKTRLVLSWVLDMKKLKNPLFKIKQKFFFYVWNLLPYILEGLN